MLKLIHYFSIPSLLSITIATAGLSVFYRQHSYQALIKQQEQQNIAIAQLFANSVWHQHRDFLQSVENLDYQNIVNHPQTLAIYQEIYRQVQGLSIVKVKVFSPTRRVVFSTELKQIQDALEPGENSSFDQAILGTISNKIKQRKHFQAFGKDIYNRQIISSYLPLKHHQQIEGVIEIYRDITVDLKTINQQQNGLIFGFIVISGCLYLVLIQIVRQAEYELKQQDAARQEAEASLSLKAQELSRSNADLEQFAYIASHDLQEPLRKIETFSDRLKSKCGDSLDSKGLEYLERMQNSASRMRVLIQDLLLFSRVTTDSQTYIPIDLNLLIQEVIKDLEIRIKETQGEIKLRNLPTIAAEPVQMRQLFQNLLSNGLKFHQPAIPPVIIIESNILPAKLHRGLTIPEQCQIKVTDNGIGLDEKYSDRIFKVFQRLHGRSEYEGTGIGLAICEKIVRRHGGSIRVKSSPGKGASFIINLPLNQQH